MSIVEYLEKLLEDRKKALESESKSASEILDKSEPGSLGRLDYLIIIEKAQLELMKIEDCFSWLRKVEIIGEAYGLGDR